MATKEAVAQLATLPERVAVVETKISQIENKLDDIKADVKTMHDCLDNTRDLLDTKLCEMAVASNTQHAELANKIGDLEKIKNKYTMYAMIGLAFAAGAGWINAINFPHVLKLFGM
jgi:phage shock protein A